jgi:thiol:disulfide interchange protein
MERSFVFVSSGLVRRGSARAMVLGIALASLTSACRSETTSPQKEDPAANGPIGPLATLVPAPAAAPQNGESWNAAQIDWQPYTAGLVKAKAENKPICLVLYTTWCPHCKNFSHVFDDPRVVEQAKSFVMIHMDAEQDSDVAQRFTRDGGYIPRTFFLGPDGTPDFDIHAARPSYIYFYDERNPQSLLAGMSEAIRKLRK